MLLGVYASALTNAENNKARLTELMGRKIAKKWDVKKKQKMTRRYVSVGQVITEATSAIDQITHRLSQITTEPKLANNVAPFVPPPATSV